MKKAILALVLLFAATCLCYAGQVRGYTRSNGTYVNSYNRSNPNSTKADNYSTKGNINPYTGKKGTKNIY